MKPPLICAAILFTALLAWRLILPLQHRQELAGLEAQVLAVSATGTEAQLVAALARAEGLTQQIIAAGRDYATTRDRLHLGILATAAAAAALLAPSILRRPSA